MKIVCGSAEFHGFTSFAPRNSALELHYSQGTHETLRAVRIREIEPAMKGRRLNVGDLTEMSLKCLLMFNDSSMITVCFQVFIFD